MRENKATSEFTIKDGIWAVLVEYDEYPETDDGSQIAYASVTGPKDEKFEYEFHFTKHLMRNDKYLLTLIDDRVKHTILKTKSFIKKGNFRNLIITIAPKGIEVQPAD